LFKSKGESPVEKVLVVLFLSDRAKGKPSIEDNQKWTLAMMGSLAFICAQTGQIMDETSNL